MPELNKPLTINPLTNCRRLLLSFIVVCLAFAPTAQALQEQQEEAQVLEQDVVEDNAFKDNLGRDTPRSSFIGFLTLSEKFDYLSKNAKRPAKGAKGATQVGAQSTYYGWLKTQPASFQDAIIGKTRGRLLRNGGLTSKEFAKLQLNRNFKPRNLADMKRIAPEAFAQANL